MHLVASSYSVIVILILWVWVGPPLLPSTIYDATALNYYSILVWWTQATGASQNPRL